MKEFTLADITEVTDRAKELVTTVNRWIDAVQTMDVEAAEDEYRRDSKPADEFSRRFSQTICQSSETFSGDAEEFRKTIFDTLCAAERERQCGKHIRLLHHIHDVSTRCEQMASESWHIWHTLFEHTDTKTILHNCCGTPDARMLCRDGRDGSADPIPLRFRSAFQAVYWFARQCSDYQEVYSAVKEWWRNDDVPTLLDACRQERDQAKRMLFKAVDTEWLQDRLDYESAWLRYENGHQKAAPERGALPTDVWLTESHNDKDDDNEYKMSKKHYTANDISVALKGVNRAASGGSVTKFIKGEIDKKRILRKGKNGAMRLRSDLLDELNLDP